MTDPLLEELYDDLLAYLESRPRSQQIELGASQVYSCRAACLLRLTGTPKSDPHVGWEALAGIERHETIERARSHRNVLSEKAFRYRGHKATIDEIRGSLVVDWKNPSPLKVAKLAAGKVAPDRSYVAQVHLGAAAAIEAGYRITTVAIAFLPRGGDVRDGYVWQEPFDRAKADAAADWLDEQIQRARELDHEVTPDDLQGLRDRPRLSFCDRYCDFVTFCQGPEPVPEPTQDAGIVDAALAYIEADQRAKAALAEKDEARQVLVGVPGINVEGYNLKWQGGRTEPVRELDVDEICTWWEMTQPDRPLPYRETMRTTPLSLPVRKATKARAR